MGRGLGKLAKPIMISKKDAARRQGYNAMIHGFEKKGMEIDKVSRHLRDVNCRPPSSNTL